MNRTLRKRKQPNQPTLNTRSSAAAAASSAAAVETPSISPVSKRIKIEKVDDVPQPLEAVIKSEPVEKSVSPAAEVNETTKNATQKSKTPEPSLDPKIIKKEVDEPPPPAAKQAEAAPKVVTKEKSTTEEVEEVEVEKEEVVPVVDPYECLSEADRNLFLTDIVGFLKRFTPKYHVPVYRTWSISKSATK